MTKDEEAWHLKMIEQLKFFESQNKQTLNNRTDFYKLTLIDTTAKWFYFFLIVGNLDKFLLQQWANAKPFCTVVQLQNYVLKKERNSHLLKQNKHNM